MALAPSGSGTGVGLDVSFTVIKKPPIKRSKVHFSSELPELVNWPYLAFLL
jgi:hypothetical protein